MIDYEWLLWITAFAGVFLMIASAFFHSRYTIRITRYSYVVPKWVKALNLLGFIILMSTLTLLILNNLSPLLEHI